MHAEIAVTNENGSESEGEIPRGLVGTGHTADDKTMSATHQGPSLFLKRSPIFQTMSFLL
jgi:hypothetical protein